MRTTRSSMAIRRSVAGRPSTLVASWAKLCAAWARWKPTRSAPSMPRSSSARRGSCMNSSGGGNGTCRKKPIRRSGRSARSSAGHELQVVVLHPDHRAGLGDLGGGLGEPLVDPLVRLPPAAVVHRLLDGVVVERPQGGVGEALVVVPDVFRGERDGVHPYAVDVGQRGGGPGASGPADPGGRGVAQEGVQRADQPTGAAPPLAGAVGRHAVVDGEAVGHHHERTLSHLGHSDQQRSDRRGKEQPGSR